jgi:hypothetical protein
MRGNAATSASGGGLVVAVPTTVEQSTFANNTAGSVGGGIFSGFTGDLTLRTSTFSANTALVGGGLMATGPAALTNATFVGNRGTDYGAGIVTNNAGAVTVTNVLLSGNLLGSAAGNCGSGSASTITSVGGNLSADTTCATFTQSTDKPNTPAVVSATLANNGGPTFTHALYAHALYAHALYAHAQPARVDGAKSGAYGCSPCAPTPICRPGVPAVASDVGLRVRPADARPPVPSRAAFPPYPA